MLLCVSSVLDLAWFMVYGLWFMVYGLWFMVYGLWFMVFIDTLNNVSVISCRSVLLVAETGVPGENHRLVASH